MYHYIKKNVTELQSKILNSALYKKLFINLRSSAGLHTELELYNTLFLSAS